MTTEPKLLTERELRVICGLAEDIDSADAIEEMLRERGLIAESVDSLLLEAREIVARVNIKHRGDYYKEFVEDVWASKEDDHIEVLVALAALRRGMGLRPTLTREMVEKAVRPNVTLVSGGGTCLCEVAIDFGATHAALLESLS